MTVFIMVLKREFSLALKNPSYSLNPMLFFIISVSLFPLAISPEADMLSQIAPGIIWVCAMLSVLLSLNIMFYQDYDNGLLEQMLMSKHSTTLLVLAKITAHWLISGLPLILISPILAVILFLDGESIKILVITLLLGTPSLSLIGAIGAALTVHIRNSGMLIALIVLPLYIPILIFAISAIGYNSQGLAITGQLYFLAFIAALSLLIAPFITKIALKISLE